MNKNIEVSIIMAEYNTEIEDLKLSLESILNQTFANWELILIDDCGKNDLEKIVKEINDNRIKLIKNDKNMGLVYSLNKAIENANGKYIARMDTDDYSYPERIEKQVEFLKNNDEYSLVSSNADLYDGNEVFGRSNSYGEVSREKLISGCPIIHPSVMYKGDVMRKIGGYLDYKRCEDYATWIEFFVQNYKMFVMKDKLIRYHLSENDYKKRTLKTRKDFFRMIKEQYIKLRPSKKQILFLYVKNILAGLIPGKIMFRYHKQKFRYQD